MELKDIITKMDKNKDDLSFSQTIPEKLKRLAEENGLQLEFRVFKTEWKLDTYVQPGRRTFFYIENKAGNQAILGMILVPDPKRKHEDIAWNRIEAPLRLQLNSIERNGWKGKTIKIVLLQIWEKDRQIIQIPLKELNQAREFRDSGNFHVKKEGGEFSLRTPHWDDNIRLREGIDNLFNF